MKRFLKYFGMTVLSLIVGIAVIIGILLHFVFTPSRLTPVVERSANELLHADIHFDAIELTFFSTFPNFGLEIRNGSVASRVFRDTARVDVATDSLVSFKLCRVVVNPMDYLFKRQVVVKELLLETPRVYAYLNAEGIPSWEVTRSSELDTLAESTPTLVESGMKGIDIQNVRVVDGELVFDDRANHLYAKMEGLDVEVSGNFMSRTAHFKLDAQVKNMLLWREGHLLVNRLAMGIQTGMHVCRDSLLYIVDKAVVEVNGVKFGIGGRLRGDTSRHELGVDLTFGIRIPSLKTILELVPETILKRNDWVTVSGDVRCEGTLRGIYGKQRVPVLEARFRVHDGAVRYAGMPYVLEKLEVDVESVIDLQGQRSSFVKLNRLLVKGTDVEVDVSGWVEELLTHPRVVVKGMADVDFSILPRIFPLEEGVTMRGALHAAMDVNILLADVKNRDYGRMDIRGGCTLRDVVLASERDSISLCFQSVGLSFGTNVEDKSIRQGKNLLNGAFGFDSVDIRWKKALAFHMDTSFVQVKTSPLRDTTVVASMSMDVRLGWMDLTLEDSVRFQLGRSQASIALSPFLGDPRLPLVKARVEIDSLRVLAGGNRLRLTFAGFDLSGVPDGDDRRLWKTSGVIGFKDLRAYTPMFPLRLRMPETRVTLAPGHVRLDGAKLMMGSSDVLLTGEVCNLAGAFLHDEELKANLNVRSKRIDCNQLIKALEVGEANRVSGTGGTGNELSETDVSGAELETGSVGMADSAMAVFVVPSRVDFTFETSIDQVLYGKLALDSVHGKVFMRNQCVELSDLSMRSMAADVKTTMLYRASSLEKAYAGFDLRLDDIHVGALIDFMPVLDTIVPMLRSFDGVVDFHVAAETELDSSMGIVLSTLRAAAYVDGKDLVLLDGETFSEISKMLMFKNKERNLIDSLSVDFTIKNGVIEIFPFLVELDRYKVAVGGEHRMDMTFKYHVSLLKSPIPFRAGVDISGTLDKMKFRITKAKYKDLFIPSRKTKVDSAQLSVRKEIRRLLNAVGQK